jgi:hypothetical protein
MTLQKNDIRCSSCNELLVDDKGPLHPHAIIEKPDTREKKYYCLSGDECLEDMEKAVDLHGWNHIKDIEARDRSLVYPADLHWTKHNTCTVRNTSIDVAFRIKRRPAQRHIGSPQIYTITRIDTGDELYKDLQGDEKLDYYLQVLNIDKVITKA